MPLLKGKENIGKNIKTEIAHGKPRKQAIAIALETARKGGADIPKKKSTKTSLHKKAIERLKEKSHE